MFETFGTEEWVVALILTAILVVLVAIVVYRKRQEAETDIFLGDLTGDDISIILTGTITQKDLQKTIKLLKEVSLAVRRTEQKATALKKIEEYQAKIDKANKEIEKSTAAIRSKGQQP